MGRVVYSFEDPSWGQLETSNFSEWSLQLPFAFGARETPTSGERCCVVHGSWPRGRAYHVRKKVQELPPTERQSNYNRN